MGNLQPGQVTEKELAAISKKTEFSVEEVDRVLEEFFRMSRQNHEGVYLLEKKRFISELGLNGCKDMKFGSALFAEFAQGRELGAQEFVYTLSTLLRGSADDKAKFTFKLFSGGAMSIYPKNLAAMQRSILFCMMLLVRSFVAKSAATKVERFYSKNVSCFLRHAQKTHEVKDMSMSLSFRMQGQQTFELAEEQCQRKYLNVIDQFQSYVITDELVDQIVKQTMDIADKGNNGKLSLKEWKKFTSNEGKSLIETIQYILEPWRVRLKL